VLEPVVVPELVTEEAKPLSSVLFKSSRPSASAMLVSRPLTTIPAPAAAGVVVVVLVVVVAIVFVVVYSGDSDVMKVATAKRTSSTALACKGFQSAAWATRSHTAASDRQGISCVADTSGM
jgi:hypothetical protein